MKLQSMVFHKEDKGFYVCKGINNVEHANS
jgi:hypothetical protein